LIFPRAQAGAVAAARSGRGLFSGLNGDCAAGMKNNLSRPKFLDRRLRDEQVPEVNRVERAAI